MLRDPEESEAVVEAVIEQFGQSAEGLKALPYILEALGNENDTIRAAASTSVFNLYEMDARAVAAALSRAVLTRTDEIYLVEGTRLLAAIADPSTVPALTVLVDSPYDEVKKNVTWALYRISAEPNLKTVDALKKLVTSETEALTVRINAVRGLGNIGLDSAQLKVWQTLSTIVKLRGDKYYMLRYFAIEALGELRSREPEVISVLVSVALREPSDGLKKASVLALKEIGRADPNALLTLENLYNRTDNVELKILIVEALGDLGGEQAGRLAAELIDENPDSGIKRRAIYTLANIESFDSLNAILDAAVDTTLEEYIFGVLEDCNQPTMMSIIERRLKTETNGDIRALMENLSALFQAAY
jgi:HEAT repeat protein